MVETMNRFHKQLLAGLLLWGAAGAGLLLAHQAWRRRLPDYAFISGWVLFGFMVLLTLLNARKKIPFLPLGRAEIWLQIHIGAGFLGVLVFLIHLDFRAPHGGLGMVLTVLFGVVTGSGVAGLILSRTLPKRLQTRGGEVIYEQIPALRHRLKAQAETLALGPQANSPAIAEFYARRLADFFDGPRNLWRHLLESSRPVNQRLAELNELRRYLNQSEGAILDRLAQLVRQKDGLDYHQSLQAALKIWLFVHLPFTYGLMLFIVVHIVLAFAFSGGVQ
jgi:hypothetical protein